MRMQSLQLRCLLTDLVWYYKVVFGLVDILMISSHLVTRLSLEGTSINWIRSVHSLMYGYD